MAETSNKVATTSSVTGMATGIQESRHGMDPLTPSIGADAQILGEATTPPLVATSSVKEIGGFSNEERVLQNVMLLDSIIDHLQSSMTFSDFLKLRLIDHKWDIGVMKKVQYPTISNSTTDFAVFENINPHFMKKIQFFGLGDATKNSHTYWFHVSKLFSRFNNNITDLTFKSGTGLPSVLNMIKEECHNLEKLTIDLAYTTRFMERPPLQIAVKNQLTYLKCELSIASTNETLPISKLLVRTILNAAPNLKTLILSSNFYIFPVHNTKLEDLEINFPYRQFLPYGNHHCFSDFGIEMLDELSIMLTPVTNTLKTLIININNAGWNCNECIKFFNTTHHIFPCMPSIEKITLCDSQSNLIYTENPIQQLVVRSSPKLRELNVTTKYPIERPIRNSIDEFTQQITSLEMDCIPINDVPFLMKTNFSSLSTLNLEILLPRQYHVVKGSVPLPIREMTKNALRIIFNFATRRKYGLRKIRIIFGFYVMLVDLIDLMNETDVLLKASLKELDVFSGLVFTDDREEDIRDAEMIHNVHNMRVLFPKTVGMHHLKLHNFEISETHLSRIKGLIADMKVPVKFIYY